ncbi:MAG: extracellular solute-binding protein [candidate division KSB1 bacterium]|nr:extracellular solute-binding protein [candidate division KSB1 bacterium]
MQRFTLVLLAAFLILTIFLLTSGISGRDPNELLIWTQDLPPGRAVLDKLLGKYMLEVNPGLGELIQQNLKDPAAFDRLMDSNPRLIDIKRHLRDAEVLDQYLKTHPLQRAEHIYYETEELRSNFIVAALGGSGPDLVYGPADMVGPFHEMRIIQPLEAFFSEQELSRFDPMGLIRFEGHLYMIADRIGNHLALVYNKKLLPKPPQTTDELIELGKTLTKDLNHDGLPDQYTLAWNFIEPFFFVPFLGGFGGWVMDENARPTLNTEATVNACKFIEELRRKKIIPRECDLDLANQLFKQQKTAMVINGPWSWGGYLDAGVEIGLARIPLVSATGRWPTPMISAKGYCLNANVDAQRREKVLHLLRFLTRPENELEFTRALREIPSRLEVRSDSLFLHDPLLKASQDQLSVGRPMPINTEMRAIWDAMRPAYQSVLNGQLTPEQAAKQMQEVAERKIAEMRGKAS